MQPLAWPEPSRAAPTHKRTTSLNIQELEEGLWASETSQNMRLETGFQFQVVGDHLPLLLGFVYYSTLLAHRSPFFRYYASHLFSVHLRVGHHFITKEIRLDETKCLSVLRC
jgi:hypothetical protein